MPHAMVSESEIATVFLGSNSKPRADGLIVQLVPGIYPKDVITCSHDNVSKEKERLEMT